MKRIFLITTILLMSTLWSSAQMVENKTNQTPAKICAERGHILYGATVFKKNKTNETKGWKIIDYKDSTTIEEIPSMISGVICSRCSDTIWNEIRAKKRPNLWKKKKEKEEKTKKVGDLIMGVSE